MMNLGQFIKELRKYPSDASVTLEPFELYPTSFCSYRGYYPELALGYCTEVECRSLTVEDLLKEALECVGKTFTGYKGGEFKMDETTPLWVSNYGECSNTKIKEIKMPLKGFVEIHCYKVDW